MSLDDICEMVTDGTHASFKDSGKGFPFLTVKDMTENGLDFSGCIHISQEEYDRADAGNSAPKLGDVLFSKDGTVGKVCVVREKREFAVLSSIAILRPKKEIADSSYLGYILGFQKTIDEASKRKTGSAVRRIILKDLKQVEIPLPPLEEQRRIAAILDKADGVRRKRKEAIRLTEELLKSTFLEMFGDPVTNPKGWEIAKLGDFGKILTGNTPPRSVSENYGDEIEWIKSDNITTPEHFLTEAEEKLSAKGKKIARTVPNGSVLVTCIAGSRSSIGRAALTDREVAFNQQINAVVPNSDVDPYFLYGQLFVAQHLVQAQSTDSMKGMVNKSKFSSIEFIKPPSQKQQKFGKWFLGFHRYYMNLIGGEEQSENLFNSLLQRAFRGEL
ncbi:MAG: restriction endonuclease subunit S [Microcystis aeruginosa G13-03]|nr:restriction endonuclease subunit S [Microcystis aeruginosa BS11-05]NCS50955.1 restriction endonuclease subunit S [Microcystis aeruginosa G13-05]NCT50708.1 restriction endonuclease subunit S [Microcystis aeruginosa G13-03]